MLRSAMSLPLRCSSLLRAIPACHHMHKPSPSPSLSSSPTSSFTSRPISTSVELRYPRTTLAGRAFCLPRAFGATRFFSSLPPHMELAFPALSPTMKTGNIAKWMVKIGQKIAPGDHLCDVETDKATMAWEAQEDGFVAAILKEDGASDVAVGEIVMVLCESVSDVKAFENFKPSAPQAAAAAAAPQAAAPPPKAPQPAAPSKPAASPAAAPASAPANVTVGGNLLQQLKAKKWAFSKEFGLPAAQCNYY